LIPVIPAQAGIQPIKKSGVAGQHDVFVRYAERMFLLDSSLRWNDGVGRGLPRAVKFVERQQRGASPALHEKRNILNITYYRFLNAML
jgi:hypothetical protein